ncbi:MAG TPA: transposase [Thermoanaerobaculia bacterium]|nr:transposase [Thermoanaerobaculia bacterium]
MSRPLRLEYPGSLHHVTSRGNERQNIFRDDIDRELFLGLLGACVKRFDWILTAYVLMTNHFHFVVQLTQETLSTGMKWLNGKYAQAFNRRHDRVGHLFQGRPDMPLVEKETYLLEVLRYDVLNPVRARMVARPEDYVWSSHRAVLGLAAAPEWLAVDDLLVNFGQERELARAAYREFVNAAIGSDESPWTDLVGQIYLGSTEWMEKVRDRVDLKPRADAHPRLQRFVAPLTMTDVIHAVAAACSIDPAWIRCGRGGTPRMVAAWIAAYEAQLRSSEIAAGLRLRSAGNVTRLVGQCDQALRKDSRVQECIDRCLSTISRKSTTEALTP